MNILPFSTTWLFFYCLLSLCAAASCMTLFYAYTLTERAGINRLSERRSEPVKYLEFWIPRWDLMRITILLCAMIFQIFAVACAIAYRQSLADGLYVLSIAVVLVVAVLFTITLNLIPVTFSERYADMLSLVFLKPVAAVTLLFYPVAWPIVAIEKRIERLFTHNTDSNHRPSPEDTIISIVNNSQHRGLDESERKMIRRVFDFSETQVREIMTPRTNMIAVEDTCTIDEVISLIRESWHSRIPVFSKTLDEIAGVVHVKDILMRMHQDGKDQKIAELVSPLIFVPGSMPTNFLFQRFIKQQAHMAIVLDEYGGTDGLVTMENVIEELVGEINDEYDHEEVSFHPMPDGSVVIDADMSVSELNERMSLTLPEDSSYETIGGLILEHIGRIPESNENIALDDVVLSILEVDERRILKVLLKKTAPDREYRDKNGN